MATSARRLALRILLDCERGSAALGDLLAAPQVSALPPRDRAFLQELVLGSLRIPHGPSLTLRHALAAGDQIDEERQEWEDDQEDDP